MKIIEVSKMQSTRAMSVTILRVSKNKVTFGVSLASKFESNEDAIHLQFAEDEGTLFLRTVDAETENSIEFNKRSNKQWECYNSTFAAYLKKLSGSEDASIPFRVVNANEDGWYPVITSYWKTIENSNQ